jgi:transglutaminase-like putative cysteine protease
MQIRAGYDIEVACEQPTPLVLMLSVHPLERGRLLSADRILTRPSIIAREFRDAFGNICHRLTAAEGVTRLRAEFLMEDDGTPDPVPVNKRQHLVEELPDEVLQFLLPSRYCDTEKLQSAAWDLFGRIPPGWERVRAIADYAHRRIRFNYADASSTRTAYEANEEGKGVCRDYAHLAVALCRCLNIPARYVNGYLGDIGVPIAPYPMDFSAWFQVWLGGQWWHVDARHNVPRIGRILIAAGRDAADVAMITSFGAITLPRFEVITDEVPDEAARMTA